MFTEAPVLRELERIMQQIPDFAPRGYGVMVLCEHENTGRGKNIRCKLERCVCMKERIQAGAATQKEVLMETLSSIPYPPFQRRLEQHLKEREESMPYHPPYYNVIPACDHENSHSHGACLANRQI